jgi:hypothetical protein
MAVCRSARPALAALVGGAALRVVGGLGLRRGEFGGCESARARARLLGGHEVLRRVGGAYLASQPTGANLP